MKLLSEIYRDLIEKLLLVLIILLFCGYAVVVSPEIEDDDNSLACKFPCQFQEPAYWLDVTSAKYEYLKTIKRKGE